MNQLYEQDPWAADPRASLSELQSKLTPTPTPFNHDATESNPFEFEQSQHPTPVPGTFYSHNSMNHTRSPSDDISAAQSLRHEHDPLLATLLIDFHHNLGPIIEFCHPPNLVTDHDFARLLPFLALPDGAHMTQEDFSYFHLKPPEDGKLGNSTVFGISCNRQLKASDLIEKDSHVTRSIVQKAIVVLTKRPVFGPIR